MFAAAGPDDEDSHGGEPTAYLLAAITVRVARLAASALAALAPAMAAMASQAVQGSLLTDLYRGR